MLPVFDLNSTHSLCACCLWGMTCLFKAPLWIPHDTALQPGLLCRAGSPAKQAAFWVRHSRMEFSTGPCQSAAGSEANRIYSVFKFVHSPGYIGLSLIKRKDVRFFLGSSGSENQVFQGLKQKLALSSQCLEAVRSFKGRREPLLTLLMRVTISPSLIVNSSSFCASYGNITLQ